MAQVTGNQHNITDVKGADLEKKIRTTIGQFRKGLSLTNAELAESMQQKALLVSKVMNGNRKFVFIEQLKFFLAMGIDAQQFYQRIGGKDFAYHVVEYDRNKLQVGVILNDQFNEMSWSDSTKLLNLYFGQFIREVRLTLKPCKLTMRTVGAALGVPHSWVGKIEVMGRRIQTNELLQLGQVYGISLGKIDSEKKVDSLIVAVGHNEFRSKSAEELRSYCKGSKPVIADVKSIYNRDNLIEQGFSVFRL